VLIQLELGGSPYIGVYARANDTVALVPPSVSPEVAAEIGRALEVTVVTTTLGGSTILGSVLAMNNKGIVVADFADDAELEPLLKAGLKVARITGKYNAAGNNILANDNGAVVNPDLGKQAITLIEEALGVPVERATLAGLKTVGSAGFATNKGVLVHPKTTQQEREIIERVLKVKADIGTINHGAPYIGAGLIGNNKGAAIGIATTGPELNRIEDALGYI